jgi:hypothetical protein
MQFLPQYSHAGVIAMNVLLLLGLVGLLAIWWRERTRRPQTFLPQMASAEHSDVAEKF